LGWAQCCTPVIPAALEAVGRRTVSRHARAIWKISKIKRGIEHDWSGRTLPNKCKALSSSCSTPPFQKKSRRPWRFGVIFFIYVRVLMGPAHVHQAKCWASTFVWAHCREQNLRSLWELNISTAVPNNRQAEFGWHGLSLRRVQNAAQLLFLSCLSSEN
jgi:hypothetical protein